MKYYLLLLLVLASNLIHAQEKSIDISNLQTPNSPGFQILDISPSSIVKPTSPKQFALSLLNASNSGSLLPKNLAIEMSPYWIFKHNNDSVNKYLNVDTNKSWFFSNIGRKSSLSLASVYSDSTSGSLLKNTNYISIGVRTNLLTIRQTSQSKAINSALIKMASIMGDVAHSMGMHDATQDPNAFEKNLAASKAYQDSLMKVLAPPLIQLDIAAAYSEAFANSEFSNQRFNRSEAWATLTVTSPTNVKWGNLAVLGIYRFLNDNVLTDTAKSIFKTETAMDLGASLNYSYKQFSLSYEYLKRNYTHSANLNSNRSVLLLQYKVSPTLYITGTYGQNFGTIKNLFALLGLNFGFGNTPLVNPNK